jgi:hypothetical protein
MRETLRHRLTLLAELLPFDNPNFGLDESWAALHPYWITTKPGEKVEIELRITNHSKQEQRFSTVLHAPEGFEIREPGRVRIAAQADGALKSELTIPKDCRPGLHVVTADLVWDGGQLREWTEAVVEVRP